MRTKNMTAGIFSGPLQVIENTCSRDLCAKFRAVCTAKEKLPRMTELEALKSELPDENLQEVFNTAMDMYRSLILYTIAFEAASQLGRADVLIAQSCGHESALNIRRRLEDIIKFSKTEHTRGRAKINIDSLEKDIKAVPAHSINVINANIARICRNDIRLAAGRMSRLYKAIF